jgi:hypothetical protein
MHIILTVKTTLPGCYACPCQVPDKRNSPLHKTDMKPDLTENVIGEGRS